MCGRSHDNVRAIHETLVGLPLHDRVAALVISVLEGQSRTPTAIGALIAIASILRAPFATAPACGSRVAFSGCG